MDACIIVLARYVSTRYPGTPLVSLKGASGQTRTLIERSILAVRAASQGQIPIFVPTNHERIVEEARRMGEEVIMTSPECRNGTERVPEAVSLGKISAEIVINLQVDAPLKPAHFIIQLIDAMRQDPECVVTTPCLLCDAETVRNLRDDRQAGRVGATTVVFDRDPKARYFSKEVLPFTNEKGIGNDVVPVFHHVGIYGYRASALAAYACLEPAPLENLEGLEQLRFLESGLPIRMVEVLE